jgi:hypothetical protein
MRSVLRLNGPRSGKLGYPAAERPLRRLRPVPDRDFAADGAGVLTIRTPPGTERESDEPDVIDDSEMTA